MDIGRTEGPAPQEPQATEPAVWRDVLLQIQGVIPGEYGSLRDLFKPEIPSKNSYGGRFPNESETPLLTEKGVLTASRTNYYETTEFSHPPYSIIKLIFEYTGPRAPIVREELIVNTPTVRNPNGLVVYRSLKRNVKEGIGLKQGQEGFDKAKERFLRRVVKRQVRVLRASQLSQTP